MVTNTTDSQALRDKEPSGVMQLGPGTVEVTVSVLQELLEATVEVTTAAGLREPDSTLDVALKRLGAATSSALMAHWIDTFERNGGPGREIPKLLEYALAEHLDQPADRPGAHPRDLNDRLYLRWLAHRPVNVNEATKAAFQRRWAERQNRSADK